MNWPKYVVEYGQAAALAAIILSGACAIFVVVRRRQGLRRRVLGWILILFAGFVIYESAGFLRWAAKKVNPLKPAFQAENRSAPDLSFISLTDGSHRTLADYRGKVVALNIWATWCPPCREEMPELDRLEQTYGKQGLVVIALTDEDREQVAKFTAFDKIRVVKGQIDPGLAPPALYVRGEVARPLTHIIDRQGVLRETLIGGQSYASFEKAIAPYLGP